jgi:hypothetical protein
MLILYTPASQLLSKTHQAHPRSLGVVDKGKGKGACLIVKQERYVGWKTTFERHLDNS